VQPFNSFPLKVSHSTIVGGRFIIVKRGFFKCAPQRNRHSIELKEH
jgi:hypothetical protein